MELILHGAAGRMGQTVLALIKRRADLTVVCAVDPACRDMGAVASLPRCPISADCVIDFSHHSATPSLLSYCRRTHTPVVIGTTGHTAGELNLIYRAAETLPVFHSSNLSVGIALLTDLVRRTARLFPEADIEIIETHHSQKPDTPSGTAKMLATAIEQVLPRQSLLGRRCGRQSRQELGIHAIRRGELPGIHEVIFTTACQSITLRHEVHCRQLYAEGALAAAAFLMGRPPGFYDMKDLMKCSESEL